MSKFAVYVTVGFALPAILLGLLTFLTFYFVPSKTKGGGFECGFVTYSMSGTPFSMPFFMVSLVFLLFDVEILLICVYPLVNNFSFFLSFYYWTVLVVILSATVYEWKKGILSWL